MSQPLRARRDGRADSLRQIVSVLGARRRELKAVAGERLLLLEGRDTLTESRLVEMEARLDRVEDQLERAQVAASLRRQRRSERVRQLKRQLQILRAQVPETARTEHSQAGPSSMHRLGTVLMYLGGLLVLWVALFELGLALGLT